MKTRLGSFPQGTRAAGSGAFTLNDCATLDTTAAANTIFRLPFGATAGTIYDLDWPCLVGIVLSVVPDGMPILAVSFS
jgi:hypothetical protein